MEDEIFIFIMKPFQSDEPAENENFANAHFRSAIWWMMGCCMDKTQGRGKCITVKLLFYKRTKRVE